MERFPLTLGSRLRAAVTSLAVFATIMAAFPTGVFGHPGPHHVGNVGRCEALAAEGVETYCGSLGSDGTCSCQSGCETAGDCCADYRPVCAGDFGCSPDSGQIAYLHIDGLCSVRWDNPGDPDALADVSGIANAVSVDVLAVQTDSTGTEVSAKTLARYLDACCTDSNSCVVYNYSNGDNVTGYALDQLASTSTVCPGEVCEEVLDWNILEVRTSAGNGGGSALGDFGFISELFTCSLASHLGPTEARALYDHNNTRGVPTVHIGGFLDQVADGDSSYALLESGWLFLPWHNDGAVAYHSAGARNTAVEWCGDGLNLEFDADYFGLWCQDEDLCSENYGTMFSGHSMAFCPMLMEDINHYDQKMAYIGLSGQITACTTAADCNDDNDCTIDDCNIGDVCAHTTIPFCDPETCGDGDVGGSEECDDGGTANGDGCSAYCEIELAQTSAQQKCITGMNKAGSKVALTQGKINAGCVKDAGKVSDSDPTACVVADARGKLAKARVKTLKVVSRNCTDTPDFGFTDASTVNGAASSEELALLEDVFGPDLNASLIVGTVDKRGAYCQAAAAKTYEKIVAAKLKAFGGCKKTGLKSGYINSRARLEECFDGIIADPGGRIAKAIGKLDKTMDSRCGDYLVDAFPGKCQGQAEFAQCVDTLVECRVCLMLNAMDDLGADCDAFDDGVLNSSCPGEVSPPPTTSTTSTTSTTTTTVPLVCECNATGTWDFTGLPVQGIVLTIVEDGGSGELRDNYFVDIYSGTRNGCTGVAQGSPSTYVSSFSFEITDDNCDSGESPCEDWGLCAFVDKIQLSRTRTSYCGDGTVDQGEECDDGNFVSGDGCNWVEAGGSTGSPQAQCVSVP